MTELKPCPFCEAHLELMPSKYGERIFSHPENGCIIEDVLVADDGDDPENWNTRALPRPSTGLVRVEDVEKLHDIQQWFERALNADSGLDYLNGDDGRDDGCDAWDDAHTLLSELLDILPRLVALPPAPAQDGEVEKMFPMLRDRPAIPWGVAAQVYAVYSALYGTSQSLETLAKRGGFGWKEVDEICREYSNKHGIAALKALIARATLERSEG